MAHFNLLLTLFLFLKKFKNEKHKHNENEWLADLILFLILILFLKKFNNEKEKQKQNDNELLDHTPDIRCTSLLFSSMSFLILRMRCATVAISE